MNPHRDINGISIPESAMKRFSEKEQLEQVYRQWLVEDLTDNRTKFRAGPYEAHIQYSNFCNMSCIMCWNGKNPPTKKTSPELLKKIGEQLGTHLSVITPYSGSEPLVLSWDETRAMALKYGIMLCITTNVQFLDEKKFFDLKDIAETLILSIDSHIPEVFEKIRPRGNSKKVFQNLATTAKLCLEHRLECIVNVVLLTDNAPHLPETVAYLADLGIQNVNIIQLLDVNGESRFYDPLLHFSDEYVGWIKKNCLVAAQQKNIRLIWSISGYEEFDYRTPDFVPENPRKEWNDIWDLKMKRMFPGFCRNAYGRLRVDSEGDVAPCCYATQGELSLGNLNQSRFDEIWNGPEAQDLRRGMFCGDVPALCQSCRFHDPIGIQQELPFVEYVEQRNLGDWKRNTDGKSLRSLDVLSPSHASRHREAPVLRIEKPDMPIKKFFVALSVGGEIEDCLELEVQGVIEDGFVDLLIPGEIWESLRQNVGYWWMAWCIPHDSRFPVVACHSISCLIRHQDYPRLPNSSLRYEDQGFKPITDLGGHKQPGWKNRGQVPDRPKVAETGENDLVELAFPPHDYGKSQLDAGTAIAVSTPHSVKSGGAIRFERAPTSHPPAAPTTEVNTMGRGILSRVFHGFFSDRSQQNTRQKMPRGFLDQVNWKTDSLGVAGWMLLPDGAADSIEFIAASGSTTKAIVIRRPDIEAGYPYLPTAIQAGFYASLPDNLFWNGTCYEFTIIGKRSNVALTSCQITIHGLPTGEAKINRLLDLNHGSIHIRKGDIHQPGEQ